jgi:DsbC/DsbD-like thiol-disulfide interchange protein
VQIKGEKFVKIKRREFTSGNVYKTADATKFLRVGNVKEIKKEALYVENLYNLGFPVPHVLEKGQINGHGYYIEQSIGKITFGEKFREEYLTYGKVKQNTFKSFCDIMCIFFNAQLNAPCHTKRQHNFKKTIMLSNILEENPDFDPLEVKYCIEKINKRLPVITLHLMNLLE